MLFCKCIQWPRGRYKNEFEELKISFMAGAEETVLFLVNFIVISTGFVGRTVRVFVFLPPFISLCLYFCHNPSLTMSFFIVQTIFVFLSSISLHVYSLHPTSNNFLHQKPVLLNEIHFFVVAQLQSDFFWHQRAWVRIQSSAIELLLTVNCIQMDEIKNQRLRMVHF